MCNYCNPKKKRETECETWTHTFLNRLLRCHREYALNPRLSLLVTSRTTSTPRSDILTGPYRQRIREHLNQVESSYRKNGSDAQIRAFQSIATHLLKLPCGWNKNFTQINGCNSSTSSETSLSLPNLACTNRKRNSTTTTNELHIVTRRRTHQQLHSQLSERTHNPNPQTTIAFSHLLLTQPRQHKATTFLSPESRGTHIECDLIRSSRVVTQTQDKDTESAQMGCAHLHCND